MRIHQIVGILTVAAITAAAAGCDRGNSAVGGPDEPPVPGEASGIQPGLRWSSQIGDRQATLTLFDAEDAPLAWISCDRERGSMTVVVETFHPVGSEERLSFGVDGEPFVFVADPTADRRSGVEAEAPISRDLLDRFRVADRVSAVYGAQSFGPYMPPDPETSALFVDACNGMRGA